MLFAVKPHDSLGALATLGTSHRKVRSREPHFLILNFNSYFSSILIFDREAS
jgi:hypothetical protein